MPSGTEPPSSERAPTTLPDDLLQRSADEGTRRAALVVLGQGRRAAKKLGKKKREAEALHDLRVAVRRLRSLARLHRRHLPLSKTQRRALRDIQRATGGARDTEVQRAWIAKWSWREIEQPGVDHFLATRPSAAKPKGVKKAKQSFDELADTLEESLSWVRVSLREGRAPESYGTVLAGTVRMQLADLAALLEAAGTSGGDARADAFHDARIEGKKLRYVLEPARALLPGADSVIGRLKDLQETLGDLHDMQLLAAAAAATPSDDRTQPGLDALIVRAREEEAAKLAHFGERFGSRLALAALVDQVEGLARRLDASAQVEVERKFLLRALPPHAKEHPSKELLQGYLPGGEIRERLRRIGKGPDMRYRRTLKAGRGIQRIEVEEETSASVFAQMWPLTEGARVHKRRYMVREGDLVWEIDEFLDRALWLAEVELPSADMDPPLPDWLAPHVEREVTDESTYVNQNLAQ